MPQDVAIQASHRVSLIRPTQQLVAVPWDKVQSNKEFFKPTESASIQKAACMNGWLCSGFKKCWLVVKPYGTGYHHGIKGYMHMKPCLREATTVACMPAGLCCGTEL